MKTKEEVRRKAEAIFSGIEGAHPNWRDCSICATPVDLARQILDNKESTKEDLLRAVREMEKLGFSGE